MTLVAGHKGFAEAEIVILTGRMTSTVITIVPDVAGFPVGQTASEVRVQVMKSPFRGVYEYTGLLVPAITPFTFHWNEGLEPGFTGVAVKVTDVPAQTVSEEAVIETSTGMGLFTVIVMEFEVAGFPMGQGRSEVRMHCMTSPLAGV